MGILGTEMTCLEKKHTAEQQHGDYIARSEDTHGLDSILPRVHSLQRVHDRTKGWDCHGQVEGYSKYVCSCRKR